MISPEVVTKTVKKYGNSGGVYVPSSWIGGQAEVRLLSRPAEPEKDLPLALAENMKHVVSILLYGSYARNEQTEGSDIDVIVVTDAHAKSMKIPKELKDMNYDIRVMERQELMNAAENDIIMRDTIEGSRILFNESFISELRPLKNGRGFRERLGLARSSLNVIRSLYETGGNQGDLVYPILMRIKEMLLIKCITEKRNYSHKILEESLKKKGITKGDSIKLIDRYRGVRDGRKPKRCEFDGQTIAKAIGLFEELLKDAEKKEKAAERD